MVWFLVTLVLKSGRVLIEDDTEIGSGCGIERGTLDDTIIGRGSKIGDLVANRPWHKSRAISSACGPGGNCRFDNHRTPLCCGGKLVLMAISV